METNYYKKQNMNWKINELKSRYMDSVNLVKDKKEIPRSKCERYSNFKAQLMNLTDIASKAFKGVDDKLKENEKQRATKNV